MSRGRGTTTAGSTTQKIEPLDDVNIYYSIRTHKERREYTAGNWIFHNRKPFHNDQRARKKSKPD